MLIAILSGGTSYCDYWLDSFKSLVKSVLLLK